MRRRIHHSLDVVSLVSGYVPTEESDLTVKDAFYATLKSLWLIIATGEILFSSGGISMHRLAPIGMDMLVPMGLEL